MSGAARSDDIQKGNAMSDQPTNANNASTGNTQAVKNQDPPKYTAKESTAAFTITEPTTADQIQAIIDDMSAYFNTGVTQDVRFRKAQLQALHDWIWDNLEDVLFALYEDLGKSPQEAYETEVGLVLDEIKTMQRNIARWSAPKLAPTPLMHFPSISTVYPVPYGVAAILAPWNYPFQLCMVPLVDALAAGNVILVKPSHTSSHTGDIIQRMCKEVFDPRLVHCLFALPNLNPNMEKIKVDFMFFTGSQNVGREVMGACAQNLTPLVLELGGKSPVFVDKTADIERAGQRIAWGKCLNSGQTCVGPDYILAHEDVADALVESIARHIEQDFGDDILHNPDYPHMISQHHFDRVCGLIDNRNPNATIAYGGGRDADTLRIQPTILRGITLEDPVMNQEIFGPALPVITWKTIDEAIAVTENFGHPLACYIFSNDRAFQQYIIHRLPYGGGCINDVVIHVATNHMGFGGFGNSGLGSYHGKCGFDTFTHKKSVIHKFNWLELPVRNAPFEKWKLDIVKLLLN